MKKQLFIFTFLALFLTITACKDEKKSTQQGTYKWISSEERSKEMEKLLVGKWKYSGIVEEDGLEIIFKLTEDYRLNKEFYSQGSIEIQNNVFSVSMRGTWELKNNNLYVDCEKLAGSITSALPEYNCDYLNTQPPTEVIKIDNKEFHFKEEGKTQIAYRVQ